ncbi:MAG: hypothetical protein GTN99_11640 [Candidatus Dadabacteria bacterium]|nr:hypothetical protein [Candidatus Dadabacteria bacterium]
MEYILIAIIAIGIIVYICYPFFAESGTEKLFEEDKDNYTERRKSDLELLEETKFGLYSAIKEIEFDYGLGKLSDEDFKDLRKHYIHEAARVVSKIEELSSGSKTPTDDIEEQIRSFRGKPSAKEFDIEEEIKKHRKKMG